MSEAGILDAWAPPGPVSEAFALDFDSLVKGIMGPVGGGKTTTCIFASQAFAAHVPVCTDGIIRSKGVVVRDSFRTLEKTTLASWFRWFPRDHPSWDYTGGNDRPAVHTLRFNLADGRRLESITEFVGIGDKRVEDILRGWEGTWAWMNEGDLMAPEVLDYLTQRVGRYPAKNMLAGRVDTPKQVMMDFNAPDVDNYLYKVFVENKPERYAFYRQPSAFEPAAENLGNLNSRYYEDMMPGKADWWIRRFIHNNWGYSRFGSPVYPEFNETIHVATRQLDPLPAVPIAIGLDAGMTPAAVIVQQLPNGQIRVTDELVPGHNCGPTRFSELLVALLASRYRNHEIRLAVGDPSAQHGADTEAGELAWLDILGKALGRVVLPCFTNEPSLRFEGVRQRLTTMIDGRLPGLVVSPHCKKLVQGFAYGYRFENVRKDPNAPFKEKAEKNDFSHPHDALQYVVLELTGRMPIYDRAARGGRAGNFAPKTPAGTHRPGDFDVFAV